MSTRDPLVHAIDQMRDFGLLVEHLDLDGAIHRVDVDGEKRNKKSGWYLCHLMRLDDGREVVVGAFGRWQGNEQNSQKLKIDASSKMNAGERERLKAQQKALNEAAAAARVELAAAAAKRAKKIFLSLPFNGSSEYLKRKGVKGHGVRYMRGSIAIPLVNVAGKIVGLQFVDADGGKKFLTGTPKQGAWHLIGDLYDDRPIVLAEGYATAASIFEATGWPVAVCFDVANLLPAGKALRSLHPSSVLIVAGDEDHERVNPRDETELENIGRIVGDKTAEALACLAVYPKFKDAAGRSDWNDLHAELGLPEVREQLLKAQKNALPAGALTAESEADWQRELSWSRGGLIAMVQNCMTVLANHPAWKGVLGFDEFQKRLILLKEPPFVGKPVPRPITDGDEIEIAAWFGRRDTYQAGIPTSMAREASIAIAVRNSFHPVRDYLKSLVWDGDDRLPTFFTDHCGVADDEVSRSFALAFFISCVARVREPGCKADLMLVLEGEQGVKKSTLARLLCGPQWFADLGTAASDKDFYQIIQGRWIVEISELASFARAENSHIKRAISTPEDTFRPSYGRNAQSYPRECIFFGTVNNSAWQKDETGARRYMPLWVTKIDIDAIAKIRDQLWAEAVARYERCKADQARGIELPADNWWHLPAAAKDAQDDRYDDDIWTSRLVKWLEGELVKTEYSDDGLSSKNTLYATGIASKINLTSATEILCRVFDVELKKQDQALSMRIGRIMARLGWKRVQSRAAGKRRVWKYARPDAPEQTTIEDGE